MGGRDVSRLRLALESGAVALPDSGPDLGPETAPIVVFHPRAEDDLSALPRARVTVVQGFRPDHDFWAAQGYDTVLAPSGPYGAAVVFVPRAKALAHALIAEAVRCAPGGLIVVDGQKPNGIDSLYKQIRKRVPVSEPLPKAHGKLFSFTAQPVFDDWHNPGPQQIPGGFETLPGVFSADGIDVGSQLLAQALPQRLPAHLADLGAGWGYLSRAILMCEGVQTLDLVEADHAALTCARHNIDDPRARFHWADARQFHPDTPLEMVVMNPPFHITRAATPDLGQAFIAAAAAMLKPAGQLWMVANRHLPYEGALHAHFSRIEEIGTDPRFKIFHASHPERVPRKGR